MSSAQPRFLTTLGLALAVAGVGLAVFYLQQPATQPNTRQTGADSLLVRDDQKIAEAEQRIIAAAQEKQAAYEKAFADLNAAGTVRSISLPTRDSIHQRQEMVKRLDDASAALEEVFKSAGETLRSELLKQGFSEYTSAKAVTRFAQRANLELILKIRASDHESNAAFLEILDLLDARWGKWKPSAEDHVLFDNTADANAYNALRQRILEIAATQQAAHAEVQQRTQDAARPKP